MSSNHYEILGVRQSDTDASIRRGARAATDQIAADVSLSSKERESRLAQVQAAAAALTTPSSRDRYDASLRGISEGKAGGRSTGPFSAPLLGVVLVAIVAIGGGLHWQYDREQTRQRIERERVIAEQQEERRAKEFEARRVAEKQRLLDELRSQREADDKQRQLSNEIRSADSQSKQYVTDDRHVPPSANYSSNFDATRRNVQDQWQLNSESQRRSMEENNQRYEDAANLQRAKAEVQRQKRYLEQLERDDQYARARREAGSQPIR